MKWHYSVLPLYVNRKYKILIIGACFSLYMYIKVLFDNCKNIFADTCAHMTRYMQSSTLKEIESMMPKEQKSITTLRWSTRQLKSMRNVSLINRGCRGLQKIAFIYIFCLSKCSIKPSLQHFNHFAVSIKWLCGFYLLMFIILLHYYKGTAPLGF